MPWSDLNDVVEDDVRLDDGVRPTRTGITQGYRVTVADIVVVSHVVLVGQVVRMATAVIARCTVVRVVSALAVSAVRVVSALVASVTSMRVVVVDVVGVCVGVKVQLDVKRPR